ncbi:hypothetical protein NLG97_g8446 [Lecanicillium saksenae]|uniref:Uncharacterized protein n=1 Tax=Lecanicillium saksenae TaxID=468837 RepID=A0ACC1QLJ5_9HYPO|nr:hypothetical protein NLG97_g8446 [Lecanicillium saksenae]
MTPHIAPPTDAPTLVNSTKELATITHHHYLVPLTRPSEDAAIQNVPSGRIKRFFTKVRTGCTVCRARKIKCGEEQPICRNCRMKGRPCQYTLRWQPSGDVAAAPVAIATRPLREAAPPEWDFMQAVRYFGVVADFYRPKDFEVAWPVIKSVVVKPVEPLDFSSRGAMADGTFVCRIICDAIAGASRGRGRLIQRGDDPACAGLWMSHARYMLEHIKHLNHCIRTGIEHAALYNFQAIVDFDFMVEGFMWQAHMNGCFAYVEHIGGIAALLDKPYSRALSGLMYRVFRSNTTSPARRQVVGLYGYTDEQLRGMFRTTPDLGTPCPVEFCLAIIEITRLRFEIAAGMAVETQVASRAQTVFAAIGGFDVNAWAESSPFAKRDFGMQYGEIFRLAIELYAVLVLPGPVVLAAYPDGGAERHSRTLLRQRLMRLLELMYPTIADTASLQWPFIVAGVAAATGEDAVKDQEFIDRCMDEIWRKPLSDCSTFYCLAKLRKFWLSGQTEWEECFYEPTPC